MYQVPERPEERLPSAPGFRKYPGYDLKIRPSSSLHQIMFNETMIAASDRTLVVQEHDLRPAVYFPRADVDMHLFSMYEKQTYCPFKGTASHWSVSANGREAEAVVWSYDAPFAEAHVLKSYIAFYLDKMDCFWCNGIEQPLLAPGRHDGTGCCEQQAA